MSDVSRSRAGSGFLPDVQANEEPVILQLSRSRSAAKGNITKKIKELTEWQMTQRTVLEAREKMAEFDGVATKFYEAHSKYHSIFKDENDIVDSEEYLDKEKERIENFKSSFRDWIQRLENMGPYDHVNVQPSDSISNIGSKSRSSVAGSQHSKAGSSLASAQIIAKTKKAALKAEIENLIKEQALELERLQLKQRRQEFELSKELANVDAEEKVYNEAMTSDRLMTKSYTSETKPSILSGERVRPIELERMKTKHSRSQIYSREADSATSLAVAEEFLRTVTNIQQQQQDQMHQMYKLQDSRDQQLQQMFTSQMASSISLPNVEVPVFSIEYSYFLRSFENLIEAKTTSSSSRLFNMVQYTSGEVQDLMRSCLTMNPEAGYIEAKRLLKEKYGQNYSIASAYVNRIITASPIKSEDSVALQSFSVLLVSCRNALKRIGYRSKIENPDILLKIIEKLPFSFRQRWREIADDITYNKSREITFDDIVGFVQSWIFQKIYVALTMYLLFVFLIIWTSFDAIILSTLANHCFSILVSAIAC